MLKLKSSMVRKSALLLSTTLLAMTLAACGSSDEGVKRIEVGDVAEPTESSEVRYEEAKEADALPESNSDKGTSVETEEGEEIQVTEDDLSIYGSWSSDDGSYFSIYKREIIDDGSESPDDDDETLEEADEDIIDVSMFDAETVKEFFGTAETDESTYIEFTMEELMMLDETEIEAAEAEANNTELEDGEDTSMDEDELYQEYMDKVEAYRAEHPVRYDDGTLTPEEQAISDASKEAMEQFYEEYQAAVAERDQAEFEDTHTVTRYTINALELDKERVQIHLQISSDDKTYDLYKNLGSN